MIPSNQERIRILREGTLADKSRLLYSIGSAMDVDDSVVAAIHDLFDDRSVVRMFVPFLYGELRYYAADALARIRARRGDMTPIVMPGVPRPMSVDKMHRARTAAGLEEFDGDAMQHFAELRDRGLVTIVDEVFDPHEYVDAR